MSTFIKLILLTNQTAIHACDFFIRNKRSFRTDMSILKRQIVHIPLMLFINKIKIRNLCFFSISFNDGHWENAIVILIRCSYRDLIISGLIWPMQKIGIVWLGDIENWMEFDDINRTSTTLAIYLQNRRIFRNLNLLLCHSS